MEENKEISEVVFPDLQKNGVEIQFIKCDERAMLPSQNHGDIIDDVNRLHAGTCDTGFDIYGIEEVVIPAHGSAVVPTGVKVGYITPGFWFKIESRSGLSFKKNIIAHPGIIDNQYRGDTGVKLYNLGDTDVTITEFERIAQLAVYPIINPAIEWTNESQETARGESGFGSSGTH